MRSVILALLGLLLLFCPLLSRAADEPTGFLNKTVTTNGEARAYVLYVPHDYAASKK